MTETLTLPGRMFAGRTAEERRAARRSRLLTAAREVYGVRGYQASTVKAVCEAAGLTERYFYESFGNSEDLLCACFQQGADVLLRRVRDAAAASEGDRVRASLIVYLDQLRVDPALARVFLIEMSSVSARTDRLVSVNLDRFGALLVELMRGPDAPGPSPPRLLVRGAIGGGLHVAQAWIDGGYAEPRDDVVEVIVRLYALVKA